MALSFDLQKRVRQRGQRDVAMPPADTTGLRSRRGRVRSSVRRTAARWPSADARGAPRPATRPSPADSPRSTSFRRRAVDVALAQEPDFGRETAAAPVVRGRHAARARSGRATGAASPLRQRDHAPRAGGDGRGHRADGLRARRPRAGAAGSPAGRRGGRCAGTGRERGVPRKTVSVDETPTAYGSRESVQGPTKRRAIAEFGIGDDGGHRDPRGPDLPQQRQRLAPLLLEADARRESGRGRAAPASATLCGRYSCAPTSQACTPVHSAAVTATWQLPILPSVPEYWRCTPTDARPLLGKAGAVEHQHARSRAGSRRAAAATTPSAFHVGFGDEVLQRLIAARIAQPRPHRLHRLAAAVAQARLRRSDAGPRAARGAPEAGSNASSHVVRRASHAGESTAAIAKQRTETTTKSTMSSKVITSRRANSLGNPRRDSTKSY